VIGVYKQKNPGNILLLLLLGVILKLPMIRHPYVPQPSADDDILYAALLNGLNYIAGNKLWIYAALAFLMLFVQAMLLTRFINQQRMMNRPTYLPGMAYLLITSLFPEWNYFSAPLLVNTFFLFIFSAVFKTYHNQKAGGTIFNCGLSLGLIAMFYFPAIVFGGWIMLALLLLRPFRVSEWILLILGATTPYYFYAVYLFINDDFTLNKFSGAISFGMPETELSLWISGGVFLITVPFLMGSYYVQVNLRRMLIHIRKGWSLFLMLLITAVLIQFLTTGTGLQNWILVALPMAAFHGCMYVYSSLRIIPNLMFWLFVVFILAYQYSGPGW
jgi:hypothetical protein